MSDSIHVYCTATGSSTNLQSFSRTIFRSEPDFSSQFFDFNSVIPTPAILTEIYPGTELDAALTLYSKRQRTDLFSGSITLDSLRDRFPQAEQLGQQANQAYRETGFWNQIDWRRAHWKTPSSRGTDLVIIRHNPNSLTFSFDCSPPFPSPIFKALTKQFNLEFFCHWDGIEVNQQYFSNISTIDDFLKFTGLRQANNLNNNF